VRTVWLKWLAAALFAGSLVMHTRLARADDPIWQFEYRASGARCPPEAQARAMVVARLGFDPFGAPPRAATLRMTIIEAGARITASLERIEDGAVLGNRTLEAPGDTHGTACAELVASAALAASVLVDPTGDLARRQAPRSQPAPTLTELPAENPFTSVNPASGGHDSSPARGRADAAQFFTEFGPHLSLGLAPSPAVGITAAAGLSRRTYRISLEGRADLPASTHGNSAGAAAAVVLGGVVPCVSRPPWHACGVVWVGTMYAESVQSAVTVRDYAFFAAAGVRGVWSWPFGSVLYGTIKLEALVPLRRLSVRNETGDLWTVAPIAGSLGLGLGVRLP
jgi:hypothetical protein